MNQSKQKNLQGKEAELDLLLTDAPEQVHPIKFDALDTDLVKRVAVKARSGAGPSGLDADGWRRILISKQFGNSSSDFVQPLLNSSRKYAQQIIFHHC